MRHSFIDKYSDRKSIIHSLDPRVKFIITISIILSVLTTEKNDYLEFLFYFILIFTFILLSKVPLKHFFLRALNVIPFVILIYLFNILFIQNGVQIFYNVLIKSFLSILTLILLSSTTNFTMLLKGLEKMRFPLILIQILSFMYRYFFLVFEELERIKIARDSRYFGGRLKHQLKVFGNIIGILFLKTYEKGEKIFQSMVSRGFNGEIKTINELKFSLNDLFFSILFLVSLIGIKLWKIRLQ